MFLYFFFIKAVEATCYSAILKVPKLIIAGDHHQLPPIIQSDGIYNEALSKTLMERITSKFFY